MRFLLRTLVCALCLVPVLAEAQVIPPLVDEAFEAYASLPSRLVPILAAAKDRDSADAAAPQLLAALPALYETRSALHRITSLGDAERRLVEQKYERRLRHEWKALFEQIYRLQKTRCYGSRSFFKQFQTMCLMLEK